MNRRNFLKLFGLLAAPVSALAVTNEKILNLGDGEIRFERWFGHAGEHRVIVNGDYANPMLSDWTPAFRHGFIVKRTDNVLIESGDHMDVTVRKHGVRADSLWVELNRS